MNNGIFGIMVLTILSILMIGTVSATINDSINITDDEQRIADWRDANPNRTVVNDSDVVERISPEDFEAVATSNQTIVVDVMETPRTEPVNDIPGFTIIAGFIVLILNAVMLCYYKKE